MRLKQKLIVPLACLAIQTAPSEPSLAEKNAAKNAAIKKEWESWNAPFQPFRLIGNMERSVWILDCGGKRSATMSWILTDPKTQNIRFRNASLRPAR